MKVPLRNVFLKGLPILALCALIIPVYAASYAVTLRPGESVAVQCDTQVNVVQNSNETTVTCAPAEAPVTGQICPTWVHDAITTSGPDGKQYATWHGATDPKSGCIFGHEHGTDPRTSVADPTLPAFGYAAALHGMAEAHTGFKVFVMPKGWQEAGKTADADVRVVFHMGTSGVRRYLERFHSLEYDVVASDGRYAHVYGMGDTGGIAGSVCTRGGAQGKTFPEINCEDTYEIWPVIFQIKHPEDPYTGALETRLTLMTNVATFDPVLTRDPADNKKLVYTQSVRRPASQSDPLSPDAEFRGCKREFYAGPNFWGNSGPAIYYTDVYGNVKPGPAEGLIRQEVSQGKSVNGLQVKKRDDFCGNGIRPPN